MIRLVTLGLGLLALVIALLQKTERDRILELESTIRDLRNTLDSLNGEQQSLEELLAQLPLFRFGEIGAGQGMFQVLDHMGIPLNQSLGLVNALTDSVELLNMRLGERVVVGLDRQDTQRVVAFAYSPHPAVVHRLLPDHLGQWQYSRIDRPLEVRHTLYEGKLEQGSTLDATLRALGIPPSMVGTVNGVLTCKINFSTHARAGDRFQVVLMERFYQDSIWIDGSVLFASYDGVRSGHHEAFRYNDIDPKSSYNAHYTEDGEALIFSGLRYPLDRLHISSPFGMRRHPITGRRAMHLGVDYRAPTGTPVYAVAEGVVTVSGYDNYSGQKIAIRHKDRSESWYLHLHTRAVRQGQFVQTRQLIGRVGNTGRSTGPHLHFGFKNERGAWMDPLQKRMIATPKLEGEHLRRLKEQVKEIKAIRERLLAQRSS